MIVFVDDEKRRTISACSDLERKKDVNKVTFKFNKTRMASYSQNPPL